ncbi:hypothetical protein JCM31185_17550 [Furfurilactobacillus curtus]|uniref:Transcription regulator PadR N-terminal domain-containing protein n=1 Tax=Furfurilactobacillus curtus TaxID=1746200 RepID=A0ABQ5JPH9_9LACO
MSEMLKGLLEGIILQKIAWSETYGYEITHFLSKLGFTDISEGTLYRATTTRKKQLLQVNKRLR